METKLAVHLASAPQALAPPAANPPPALSAPAPRNDPADLRLVIEADPGTGGYVYKTIDRRTGDVVLQLPREDVVRMHQSDAYATGDVIKAQA
jgi:flagellar protein FlaG